MPMAADPGSPRGPRGEEQIMSTAEDFATAVAEVGRAAGAFVGGDEKPYTSRWAHGADVTIFGGWGDHEHGWDEVGPRLQWAAERFVSGGTEQELLAMGCSDDLGYTVALERGHAHLAGAPAPAPMLLRVTHVYRRVDGVWKIVHRHADPIAATTPAAAVLMPG
jgi:ketosteroid isomerase-like protein